MNTYKQVLEIVELALIKGEYYFCIEYLSPKIESFPISSKEGVNLRTIIITALCGVNKKDEAKKFCKELLKSSDFKTREDAKYLMEIIDSPEIKKPENWNIKLERNIKINNAFSNSIKKNKKIKGEKKFINTSDVPTGETKSFQNGFVFIIFFLLILLIPLLSGCVKIENTLDLSNIESIKNSLIIESKYNEKYPWQLNFEKRIKEVIPNSTISTGQLNFSLENKNINFITAKNIIYKIQKLASEFTDETTNLNMNMIENNFFFFKKYIYEINFDLRNLPEIEDIEIYFNIINPTKALIENKDDLLIKATGNKIIWNLIPGNLNQLKFSFWQCDYFFIGISLIIIVLFLAYLIRFYRYQIGSDLPELPSN